MLLTVLNRAWVFTRTPKHERATKKVEKEIGNPRRRKQRGFKEASTGLGRCAENQGGIRDRPEKKKATA